MRGEVWTMRDELFAHKARPVVIVQSDEITSFDSVVLCLLTSYDSEDIVTRVRIEPSSENGLSATSYVMTDKIASVRKDMLGKKIGCIDAETMAEISRQLAIVLGIEN